jgi:plastocyanin
MSACFVPHQKPTARCPSVVSPFPRKLSASTLVMVLLATLTLLSTSGTGETQRTESASARTRKGEVVINNFSFSPKILTLSTGATATWINGDNVPHVIASTDKQFKKSAVLKPGGRFSNTFVTAGTYPYFCSIHPRMTGKMIVK